MTRKELEKLLYEAAADLDDNRVRIIKSLIASVDLNESSNE